MTDDLENRVIHKAEFRKLLFRSQRVVILMAASLGLGALGFLFFYKQGSVPPFFLVILSIGIAIAVRVILNARKELERLASSYETALHQQVELTESLVSEDWIRIGRMELDDAIRGERTFQELSATILQFLGRYLNATMGALYVATSGGRLEVASTLGVRTKGANYLGPIPFGEGLVGRCARDKKPTVLTHPTDPQQDDSLVPRSLHSVIVFPFLHDNNVRCVVELGFKALPRSELLAFLDSVSGAVGAAYQAVDSRIWQQELLQSARRLSQELSEKNRALLVAQESLGEKAVALARTSHFKSEFIANVSHELRTPLNSMLILSKILIDNKVGNLTPEQVNYARTIYQSGTHLLGLINDVLDLSKVEAGKIEVRNESFSPRAIIEELHQLFEPLAKEKNLNFHITLDKSVPDSLMSDSARLSQILRNFLSNAFKFTNKGSVELSTKIEGGEILFSVSDTGIGIPEEKRELVFEAFTQADGSVNRTFGGTGLGLSICKRLSQLLGGIVSLKSVESEGSTFTLRLPIRLSSLLQEKTRIVSLEYESKSGKALLALRKILVADSDITSIFVLIRALEAQGAHVNVARDASQCLTLLGSQMDTDLLILSSALPPSGKETLKQIRASAQWKDLPVIVLLSEEHQLDTAEFIEEGSDYCLCEPLEQAMLIESIEKCLALSARYESSHQLQASLNE